MGYIQFLEKTDQGWHIRFGTGDWLLLSDFKAEQRRYGQTQCHYDPGVFGGKGGWFCTTFILLRFRDRFSNFDEKYFEAEKIYAEREKVKQEEQRKKNQQSRKEWDQEQKSRAAQTTNTKLTISEAMVVLGFSPIAHVTVPEIKKAFRQKALKAHPDHGGSHLEMVKLNQAYQLVLLHVQGVRR